MGISIGNRLLGTTGLSPGGGLSRGGGLSFGGFTTSLALNLNFLSGVLDPRITFSRPSLATYFDSTGKLTYAPNNLFVRSQEFATASWTKASAGVALSPTATDNFGVAPDGTQTASRVQFSLNGGTASADQSTLRQSNIFPVVPITSIVSFYVRSTDGVSSYNMLLFGSGSAPQAITITGSWTRISYLSTGSNQNPGLMLRGGQTPTNPNTADILVWGAQAEAVTYQTTPSTYVATTASAYYGPRFEYNPNTLVPQGLLIEEAMAANLLTYSQDFRDTATAGSTRPWTWGNATAAITTATNSPEGVQNAYKLAENLANGTHAINNLAGTVGAQETFSFYAKAAERSWCIAQMGSGGVVYYNISSGVLGTVSGATATITSVGGGWYRCTITATRTTNQNNLIYASTGDGVASYQGVTGSGIYIYGAQLEARSFATSYLPTGASTAARSADDVSMTGTNFSSWFSATQGTFISNFLVATIGASSPRVIGFNLASGATPMYLDRSTSAVILYNGSANGASATGVFTSSLNKAALGYTDGISNSMALNGGTVGTSGVDYNLGTPTVLYVGSNGTSSYLNGHIASIQYYTSRLSDAQLQALTQPSLEASMFLSFDTTSNSFTDANWGP